MNQNPLSVIVTLDNKYPENTIQGLFLGFTAADTEYQALVGTRLGIIRVDIDNPDAEISFTDVPKPTIAPVTRAAKSQPPIPTANQVSQALESMREALNNMLYEQASGNTFDLLATQERDLQSLERNIDTLRRLAATTVTHP